MTDNEIIKALECCSTNNQNCYDCPLHTDCMMGVPSKNISRVAFDLIQRQQKYIDKSVKDLKWWLDTNTEKGVVYIPEFVIENIVKGCDFDER